MSRTANQQEHVLDANVFIHGEAYAARFAHPVTVPAVVDELQTRNAQTRYEMEDVAVYDPSPAAVDRVEAAATSLGQELSAADVQVIALALDREAIIVSDDYGVQNVAEKLGVAYEGFLQDGIQEVVAWKQVCRDCGREVDGDTCPSCGGEPRPVPDN